MRGARRGEQGEGEGVRVAQMLTKGVIQINNRLI